MRKKIQLTESQLISVIKRIISEQSDHVKNLYKSWANKKSGNPEGALSIMDDAFKYQKQLSKKDFAQYTSYEELKKDIDRVKEVSKSTDITKFYEDKDLLVIAANTWEASCKYGAGSKWCTTARDNSSYYRRHNETGTEFFWIFKNKPQDDPNHKFSYHIKLNGKPDWCNAVNNCMGDDRLPETSYPKQHPKYQEIIGKLEEFHNSRDLTVKETINQKNKRFISELVDENYDMILDYLNLEEDLKHHYQYDYDYYLTTYLEDMRGSIVPRNLDLDDEEGIAQFEYDLEEHLLKQEPKTPNFNMDEFKRDISYIVYETLISEFDLNPHELIKEQIEIKNITIQDIVEYIDENEINEIISEITGTLVMDNIGDMASKYAFYYENN